MSVLGARQYLTIAALAPLIVGGQPADQAYPYMASMQPRGYAHYCGAVLVRPQWMVTAAHCVEGKNPATTRIRVGSSDRAEGGEVEQAVRFIPHPDYAGNDFDLALIQLAWPSSMAPAAIARNSPQPGTTVRLLGWGQMCPWLGCAGGGPRTLQQLDTTVVDASKCQELNSTNELCLGTTTTATACYGDSGGPALVREGETWALAGVTSRGGDDSDTCGTGNAIYTDVVAVKSWIEGQLTQAD